MSDTSCDLPVDSTGDSETDLVEADKGNGQFKTNIVFWQL